MFRRISPLKNSFNSIFGKIAVLLGLCFAWQLAPIAAQNTPRAGKDDAMLVVDGIVRQVFTSDNQARNESLVEIDVRRSDARRAPDARTHIPLPGETVYVHVPPAPRAGLFAKSEANSGIPAERSLVRAYLVPRENGSWQGTYPEWLEPLGDSSAAANPPLPVPSTTAATPNRPANLSIGMTFEPHMVKDRLVLRVKSVERGGPAQQAGIDVGDVIIGIKDEPVQSANQLTEAARRGDSISLTVVDVNTSRPSHVDLRFGQQQNEAGATAANGPSANGSSPTARRRSLGISAEPVSVGQRTALKVTRVEPGSPANKAGIEPNDILVAANGAPLTGPEQLGNALRKSGPALTLMVRDSRTGKDVPVEVAVGGPSAPSSSSFDLSPSGGTSGNLGAVTELAFYDVDPAVKVTEVDPGSPAARAGLAPGVLILEADGKPVLHPNDLTAAVRSSTGTLRLTTVDPRTGKKGITQLNLGR